MPKSAESDFHIAVKELIMEHGKIVPWWLYAQTDDAHDLDKPTVKFYACRGGVPLVHYTAATRGGLWVREQDLSEEFLISKGFGPGLFNEGDEKRAPGRHVLKLEEMRDQRLWIYGHRDIWTVVEILRELAG